MRHIWLGLAFFAVVTVEPTFAQDSKNLSAECAKQVGMTRDPGRRAVRWRDEAQHAAFVDCLNRKPNLPPAPASKKPGGTRNSN